MGEMAKDASHDENHHLSLTKSLVGHLCLTGPVELKRIPPGRRWDKKILALVEDSWIFWGQGSPIDCSPQSALLGTYQRRYERS